MEVNGVSQGGQQSFGFNNAVESDENIHQSINQNLYKISLPNDATSGTDKKITEKDVKKSVDKFNKLLEDKPTHLEYQIYGKFNDIVVSVVDDESKKIVREIPPKDIIDMIDKFCEMAGIFLDKRA